MVFGRKSILVKITLRFLFTTVLANRLYAQHTLSGTVLSSRDSLPVPNAVVLLPQSDLWAHSNEKGAFFLKGVPSGKVRVTVRYLGYVTQTQEIEVAGDLPDLVVTLQEDNLALQEVVITARQKEESLSTSFVMDRTALDHMQMLNVTDAASLLPGGKTNRTLHLATSASQRFSVIGGGGTELGNPLFGVGVEVDGVRLSNLAIPGTEGVDTRNIASSNIESIEVVTGIPSVEHGDVSNGMVRINTRKGASPFILDLVTKPNTKQVALGKGFDLGARKGVLNANLEHTRSVSDIASPYTSYARNGLSLNYTNTFGRKAANGPLELNAGLSGNIGGYSNLSDPDRFVETYSRSKDNVLRGNFLARWLLHKRWLTNLELSGFVNYNDKLSEVRTNRSSSSSVAAIHAMNEGYHIGQTYDVNPDADIILIEPGYWYQRYFTDSKALNYQVKAKATWANRWGEMHNRLLAGAEYSSSGNLGRGAYYDDMRYAPTWREYRYDRIPFNNNYAFYLEDRINVPVRGTSRLEIVGGLRSEITSIRNSAYRRTYNLSPRLNAQYTFRKNLTPRIEELSVKAGWGKTVKLPSFSTLFPMINYRDILTFAPGTTSEGATFYAYYSIPTISVFNPDLKWQYSTQFEAGLNMKVGGHRIFVTVSRDKTYHSYSSYNTYAPFTYKFTDQSNLEGSAIPIADRTYTVDRQSGIVTVIDKTGALPDETLGYKEITRFISNAVPVNGSPVTRNRVQWIVDFRRIPVIKTQFRLDGNWYYYRGVEETLTASMPNSTINMADGNPYKYIGFFAGGASWSNGTTSRSLNMNLTATTHLPAIRLILSARIEGTLHEYSQYLSEYSKGTRGFVLDNREAYTPSETMTDIYGGNRFIGVYPEYYVSLDDMQTPIPFAEKFLWAKANDIALYNELARMVVRTNYNYSFNAARNSAYFSANLGVTKEIARLASITFNATNFFSNMATYRSSATGSRVSLFNGSGIPAFYYGLSLRLKW